MHHINISDYRNDPAVRQLLVLAADTLGRALLPPLEVPAGIFTTLVGAPYFLYLLKRSA